MVVVSEMVLTANGLEFPQKNNFLIGWDWQCGSMRADKIATKHSLTEHPPRERELHSSIGHAVVRYLMVQKPSKPSGHSHSLT
jgi:hypothetical protein